MNNAVADNPLAQLDLFWTELTAHRGVVYARLTGLPYVDGWRLSGAIRGPRSVRHQTLPATIRFSDLGPGPSHLARSIVPEPSFWSPEAPNLYDVTIELHRDGLPTLTEKRQLGFRPILTGPRYLLREGKPWIPRGVRVRERFPTDLTAAREQRLMLLLAETNEDPLPEASEQGAYVAIEVAGSPVDIIHQLRWFSRSPAVVMAVVKGNPDAPEQFKQAAPNLVLAQWMEESNAEVWADAVWVPYGGMNVDPEWLRSLGKPVFWSAPIGSHGDLGDARRNCDALQAMLAQQGYGQLSGYFV